MKLLKRFLPCIFLWGVCSRISKKINQFYRFSNPPFPPFSPLAICPIRRCTLAKWRDNCPSFLMMAFLALPDLSYYSLYQFRRKNLNYQKFHLNPYRKNPIFHKCSKKKIPGYVQLSAIKSRLTRFKLRLDYKQLI